MLARLQLRQRPVHFLNRRNLSAEHHFRRSRSIVARLLLESLDCLCTRRLQEAARFSSPSSECTWDPQEVPRVAVPTPQRRTTRGTFHQAQHCASGITEPHLASSIVDNFPPKACVLSVHQPALSQSLGSLRTRTHCCVPDHQAATDRPNQRSYRILPRTLLRGLEPARKKCGRVQAGSTCERELGEAHHRQRSFQLPLKLFS
jgi:hypothetical protein